VHKNVNKNVNNFLNWIFFCFLEIKTICEIKNEGHQAFSRSIHEVEVKFLVLFQLIAWDSCGRLKHILIPSASEVFEKWHFLSLPFVITLLWLTAILNTCCNQFYSCAVKMRNAKLWNYLNKHAPRFTRIT
jgi:hypothetical protein